ncbi:protein huluwa-like [Pelodytes ibericus]
MGTVTPSNISLEGPTLSTRLVPSVEETSLLQPSLALLVFILIPCVVLLVFLNCFLLLHRFSAKKNGKRRGLPAARYPCIRVNKNGHARLRPSYVTPSSKDHGCLTSANVTQCLEATLAVGAGFQEGCPKLVITPSDYESCPSRPACVMAMPCCSCSWRLRRPSCCVKSQEKLMGWNQVEDCGGGGHSQCTRSSSQIETPHGGVPPNTPAAATTTSGVTPRVKFCHKTSTQRKCQGGSAPFTPLGSINFERVSNVCHDDYMAQLQGLDSDFGVSAGVSVHILSSDSDTCSQLWTSGMEWDYYDPCYMRRNRHRKDNHHNRHHPGICSKQYWV